MEKTVHSVARVIKSEKYLHFSRLVYLVIVQAFSLLTFRDFGGCVLACTQEMNSKACSEMQQWTFWWRHTDDFPVCVWGRKKIVGKINKSKEKWSRSWAQAFNLAAERREGKEQQDLRKRWQLNEWNQLAKRKQRKGKWEHKWFGSCQEVGRLPETVIGVDVISVQ